MLAVDEPFTDSIEDNLKYLDVPYAIEVLEGVVPAGSGPVSLFIDPFGRPMSPVSVCGVRRRGRRRAAAGSDPRGDVRRSTSRTVRTHRENGKEMNDMSFWEILLWTFWIFIWIAAIFIWVRSVFDMFSDHTLSGWGRPDGRCS